MLHLVLHIVVPAIVAGLAYRRRWLPVYLTMLATMAVDLDHLLANPIYVPDRCSIGFHPLHGLVPIILYVGLCAAPRFRIVGIGLVIHMLLDALDCVTM
ncbi:MAG: DUF6122 family protein [Gammaproteobacteria bacterium]|jgi:hypothetical protein|nr:DUF6122 family protein [Gammaproteobacteria bacterium]